MHQDFDSSAIQVLDEVISPFRSHDVVLEDILEPRISEVREHKVAHTTIYINGERKGAQKGKPEPIGWPTRKFGPGEYIIEAEVMFTNRCEVRSEPVTVQVVEGE